MIKNNIKLISLYWLFLSCEEKKGEIHYNYFESTPISRIDCTTIKTSPTDYIFLLNQSDQHRFSNMIKDLPETDENIDARAYGFIYHNNKKISFCMGVFVIQINEKKYLMSEQLRTYVKSFYNDYIEKHPIVFPQ